MGRESSERNQKARSGWEEITANRITYCICSSVWINGMLAFKINVILVLVEYWSVPFQTGQTQITKLTWFQSDMPVTESISLWRHFCCLWRHLKVSVSKKNSKLLNMILHSIALILCRIKCNICLFFAHSIIKHIETTNKNKGLKTMSEFVLIFCFIFILKILTLDFNIF